jgi:signal peptidase I
MVPTLQDGDQMLVSNVGYTPEKGDIVVLTKDEFLPVPIVKRVIATAGDEVDIDFETGEVSVNGEVLDEPYIAEKTYTYFDVEFPQTVPEGCIFVLGDNRNNSTDSRYGELGMVDTRYILGKVLCRIYPISKIGPVA